jgi:predicted NAD-dependent protein-ADP-ribosyltransferase YbiA (DUF1768 family)
MNSKEIKLKVTDRETPLEVGQVTARYQGVDNGATIIRVVRTRNDGRIVLFSSGDKVIELPGQAIRTEKPGGWIITEQPDGQVSESRIKSRIPFEEKPLNVASGAREAIGKALSNFAERFFVMDGRRYASIEAFYQGLKWADAIKRAEVAGLSGKAAKFGARGAPQSNTFDYEGTKYHFGSLEHHQLIKRAIRESLTQNPEVRAQFVETYPRPIEHKTGRREYSNSAFPGSVFTGILTELRSEFVK